MNAPHLSPGPRGFSLLELLTVIAILILLLVLAVPAVNGLMRAQSLNAATSLVNDQLVLARQLAMARNVPVQVRFWHTEGKEPGMAASAYRAVQLVGLDPSTGLPRETLSPVFWLHRGVVGFTVADQTSMNLLTAAPAADFGLIEGNNAAGKEAALTRDATFRALQFRPSGATSLSLSQGSYFLMLGTETEKAGIGTLPANFRAIQINPVNGRTRVHAP